MKIFHGVQMAEISITNQTIVIIVTKKLEGQLSILQKLYFKFIGDPKSISCPCLYVDRGIK